MWHMGCGGWLSCQLLLVLSDPYLFMCWSLTCGLPFFVMVSLVLLFYYFLGIPCIVCFLIFCFSSLLRRFVVFLFSFFSCFSFFSFFLLLVLLLGTTASVPSLLGGMTASMPPYWPLASPRQRRRVGADSVFILILSFLFCYRKFFALLLVAILFCTFYLLN